MILVLQVAATSPALAAGRSSARATGTHIPLIELRQYTLKPGQRDALIDLFEREFIESQESLGMRIIGTFRDRDRPDRFVWIRGFADMASRAAGLNQFYSGTVWKTHRDAAAATMIDTDDVLLLRAARTGSGFHSGKRPAPAAVNTRGLVIATIYRFPDPVGSEFVDFFERTVEPKLRGAGIQVRASYRSETAPNNYPRLPIRERDHAFVWFAAFADSAEHSRALARLARSAAWRRIDEALQVRLVEAPTVLRLVPTPRSALRS